MQARRSSLYRKLQPAILVRDTFTDSDGTLLVNHTPDIDTVGGGWIEVATAKKLDIFSNKARQVGTPVGLSMVAIDAGIADCVITAGSMTSFDTGSLRRFTNLVGRAQDSHNYISAGLYTFGNPWTWGMTEFKGGKPLKHVTARSVTSGHKTINPLMILTLNGTSVRLEIPSENVDLAMNTTTLLTKTRHGFRSYTSQATAPASYVDDFEITALQ